MSHRTITAHEDLLRPQVALGKSRLETLCLLIVEIIGARTATSATSPARAGGRRRLRRPVAGCRGFFQHVRLGKDWALPLLAGLVGPARK